MSVEAEAVMATPGTARFVSGDRNRPAVEARSTAGGTGVIGTSDTLGVVGVSEAGVAVEGRTVSGTAIIGAASGPGGRAGFFDGDIEVTGDILVSGGASVSLPQKLAELDKKLDAIDTKLGDIIERLGAMRTTQMAMSKQQWCPNGYSASALVQWIWEEVVDKDVDTE